MRSTWPPASTPRAAPLARAAVLCACALLFLFALVAVASAQENITRTVSNKTIRVATPRAPKGVLAKTGIVLDAETGRQLWSRKVAKRRLIASTTKIMTAIVAIARTRPTEMLTATAYRAGPGESLLGLKPGERMSAQDMIKGMLLVSGNDAADSLAADTASSRAAFVAAMNRKARQLGLARTHFANPVGLDSAGNYSTAADLAQLGRYSLTIPRFANVVDKAHLTLHTGSTVRHVSNLDPLVGKYPWAVGIKTGHTLAAGYLLVGAAKKLDARIISVVTGEPTEGARAGDSAALLKYGRAFYKPQVPLKKNGLVATLPVALQDITAPVYARRTFAFAARNGERVTVQVNAPKEIEGPRSAGSIVGTAVVVRNGKQVASVPIALRKAVPKPPVAAVMLHALSRILPWLLLLLAACLIGMYFLRRSQDRARRPEFVG
jgi:D-alanyl-D-alanine carboxypeptidase (penicillin-binding protein 5/6)